MAKATCPNCGKLIHWTCTAREENKQTQLEGVVYHLRCKSCSNTFTYPLTFNAYEGSEKKFLEKEEKGKMFG